MTDRFPSPPDFETGLQKVFLSQLLESIIEYDFILFHFILFIHTESTYDLPVTGKPAMRNCY